jgi:hypothetical protein
VRARTGKTLSKEILDYLQTQHPFIVITVGEDDWPCPEVVSWIWGKDESTIRLVIGSQRHAVANIRRNGHAVLQILGPNLAYEIRGLARIIKDRCESIRFPQTMIEMQVNAVNENMYPANFVTGDLPVSWPETTNTHHKEWNIAVGEEMRAEEENQ